MTPVAWLCSILLIAAGGYAQTSNPVRRQLIQALDDKALTDSLYNTFAAMKNRSATFTGYLAAAEALKAKHSWNPYYKIKYINQAEDNLRQAIIQEPHNIEIRFIRFSIEHNVPGFLGYNKNLDDDRQEMIKLIDTRRYAADKDLEVTIIKFLLDSDRCTPAESAGLRKHLAAIK